MARPLNYSGPSNKFLAVGITALLVTAIAVWGVGSGYSASTSRASSGQSASPPPAPPSPGPPQETREGMVTDTRCMAKHSADIAKNASDCVRICAHGGAKFALIDGETVYILQGDMEKIIKVAGQRAKITGTVTGNTIDVKSAVAGS